MSELRTIAHPYAKAAFDFAKEKGALEEWQAMLTITSTIAQDPFIASQIEDLDSSGSQSPEEFLTMFFTVCEGMIDEFGQNLIKVMAENQRLSALNDVVDIFIELKDEFEKHLQATVISSQPLSDEQLSNIKKALEAKVERSVELQSEIDQSLVGGLIVKAGGLVIDGSLKSSIDRLATRLQG